jgi:hypothetical protein
VGLGAHALLTVAELKTLQRWAGDQYDSALEHAINAASRMIATYTGRDHLVTTNADLTEYHTLPWASWARAGEHASLNLGEWPVISVTSVHEDTSRVYGAASLLVADTDYILSKPTGQLLRGSAGGGSGRWTTGLRAIKVLYKAGYQQTDGVTPTGAVPIPHDLKEAAAQMALVLFKQHDQQRVGVSSISDAASGSIQRFMGPMPPSVREMLQPYCRVEFSRTWERPA